MSKAKTGVTVASAACLAMACASIQKYEGYAPTVVPDRLAGGLPTGGFGETEHVRLGETHDRAYWGARLQERIEKEYDTEIGRCIHVELPDGVRAVGDSIAYNAGPGALCGSRIVAKWNAGDVAGGCAEILTRNAAGQFTGFRIASRPRGPGTALVVQRGLINRRAKEQRDCFAAAHDPVKPAPAVEAPVAPAVVEAPAPVVVPPAPAPKPAPRGFWRHLSCMVFKCQ